MKLKSSLSCHSQTWKESNTTSACDCHLDLLRSRNSGCRVDHISEDNVSVQATRVKVCAVYPSYLSWVVILVKVKILVILFILLCWVHSPGPERNSGKFTFNRIFSGSLLSPGPLTFLPVQLFVYTHVPNVNRVDYFVL